MSEAKMKERIKKLEIAIQAIIRERGEVYGDVDMQSLWDAIEDAKKVIDVPLVGKYGRMINDSYGKDALYTGPGIGTSVQITAIHPDKYRVKWFVNANQPLYSVVPKEFVEVE